MLNNVIDQVAKLLKGYSKLKYAKKKKSFICYK